MPLECAIIEKNFSREKEKAPKGFTLKRNEEQELTWVTTEEPHRIIWKSMAWFR